MDFDSYYTQLEDYIKEVEKKFLLSHLEESLATPKEYNLDVKSFCILCHAAFEEFVELIALQVMSQSIKKYTTQQILTAPITTLMHFKGNHGNYLDRETENLTIENIEKIFDYNRKQLLEIKSKFSKEIYNNHGISLKYMRNLLMPISIDIPKDVNWSNSMQKLAVERGSYAHKFLEKSGRVKLSIEPEKAKTIVEDCLQLFKEIKERAKKKIE